MKSGAKKLKIYSEKGKISSSNVNLAGFSVNDEDSFQLKRRKWTGTFTTGNDAFVSTLDTVEVLDKETGGTLHLSTLPA